MATVRSSATTKPVGASLKVTVTVVVSPALSALSPSTTVALGGVVSRGWLPPPPLLPSAKAPRPSAPSVSGNSPAMVGAAAAVAAAVPMVALDVDCIAPPSVVVDAPPASALVPATLPASAIKMASSEGLACASSSSSSYLARFRGIDFFAATEVDACMSCSASYTEVCFWNFSMAMLALRLSVGICELMA